MSDKTPNGEHETEHYEPKIDRRTALAWVGVVGAATAVGAGVVVYGPKTGGDVVTHGYGTDPKLTKPEKAPWTRIMTRDQLTTAAILADYILPANATAPSASSLGVPDFVNEWVSAPYPDQLKDRPLIMNGLNQLSVKVLKASPEARAQALEAVRTSKDATVHAFWKKFRRLTIGAYYTTDAGFKDVGFIGNVARDRDPGPSPEVKAHLEEQFKKLNL